MRIWASFYAPNLRYRLKHKKISPNLAVRLERRQISQNLNGRFSLNFPDSCMAIRWIICASLVEFLCAKLEISFKTQDNISKFGGPFGTQTDISKFEW